MRILPALLRRSSASTKLRATERVQGWIEFSPSGHVIAVSDTLLAVVGFRREELIGQHHRVLCDPAYTNSKEYAQLWERLRRGEHDTGIYPRRTRAGADVWLQALYAPVKRFGRVTRIVQFATDVTAQRRDQAAAASRLAAVDRTQAMIEFSLDGMVLNANANFLAAMGYAREDIIGKHHRMFCESAFAQSQDYTDFWRRLGTGESFSGTYKRLARGGREIWIQGAYNPLLDANGRPYGVVKACVDVTAQVRERMQLEALVREASGVLTAMSNGDLTQRMRGAYDGDLAALAQNVNTTASTLAETLKEVDVAARTVSMAVGQLAEGSDDLAQRTSQQVGALEETAAAVEELTASVTRNAEHAQAADTLSRQARTAVEESGAVMQDALSAMAQISESGRRIGEITRVLDDISFQTNILALNAAVEAARAGDHGRGFAVVADEVRSLALRSATASKEIGALIEETLGRVSDGNRLVSTTASALTEVVGAVQQVSDLVAQVRAATDEQAAGIHQVHTAISSMDSGNQQNASLVEELSAAAQQLDGEAGHMREQVAHFTLSTYPDRAPSGARAAQTAPVARPHAAPPRSQPTSRPRSHSHSHSRSMATTA